MNRKVWIPIAWVIGLVIAVFALLAPRNYTVLGYIYDPCGGCGSEPCKPCTLEIGLNDYLLRAAREAGVEEQAKIIVRNLLYKENQKRLDTDRAQRGLPEPTTYPVVMVGKQVLMGWQELESQLIPLLRKEGLGPLALLLNREVKEEDLVLPLEADGENRIVYFYIENCAECTEADQFLQTLNVEQDFILSKFDMSEPMLLQAYCEEYNLDMDEVVAPTVFIGGYVLEGREQIELFLEARLEAGEGRFTPIPQEQTR